MTKGECVKDIYDEFVPFYDLSYAERQAEIAFYTSLLRGQDRSVLELGCGTGTIVAAIGHELSTRHGAASRAVGVDRSIKMLEWAQRRYPSVEWIQGDLTCPPVQPHFDLVVCAFNTLQMLESDAAVLRTFEASRDLLGPNGLFVFDVYNASSAETPGVTAGGRLNRVVRSFKSADGHLLEVREDAVEDATGGSVQLDWRVVDTAVIPPEQRARLVLRLRHYSPDAIERLTRAAGLRIIDRYGDVRRSTFNENGSKKQVVICSR